MVWKIVKLKKRKNAKRYGKMKYMEKRLKINLS